MPSAQPRNASRFKVVVVGAGIAGLTASHCLIKAGIDHIVFEKSTNPYPANGAGVVLYAQSSRILAQLGILSTFASKSTPLEKLVSRKPDGNAFLTSNFFDVLTKWHGAAPLCLERRDLLQTLYDVLPVKEQVHFNKRVVDVRHHDEGVSVTLANGEVIEADLVIGADGAYSIIRDFMWSEADRLGLNTIPASDKNIITTKWKALVGISPNVPGLSDRNFETIHDNGRCILLISQPGKVFFFAFLPQDPPFHWPQRNFLTAKDMEEAAKEFQNAPLTPQATFGEMWDQRYRAEFVNVEEGVLSQWHSGRIVLAGDSAHKITPNMGFGANSSMESVAALCSQIKKMLSQTPPNGRVSQSQISQALDEYQAMRVDRMRLVNEASSTLSRIHAWSDQASKTMSEALIGQSVEERVTPMSMLIRSGAKLDFVRVSDFPRGSVRWDDEPETAKL